ncbi:hypothetical protein LTR17_023536 [Elasticomyces elasticus]|nr:hypothetical protein LTR17_023536 [Elasticomyces elasticus]
MASAKNDWAVDKFDRYWRFNNIVKMSKYELLLLADNAGYPTYSLTKIELRKLADRLQRSLVCYNRCSNDELLKFMQDRGIAAPSAMFWRTRFIDSIIKADQQTTFGRFMDLVPELRVMVYEYYLADFPNSLVCPVQPPMSRVSRQTRTEVLPMFCDQTQFCFELIVGVDGQKGELRFDADATSFVLSLGHSQEMLVRSVRFKVGAAISGMPSHCMCLTASISQDGSSSTATAGPVPIDEVVVVVPVDAATKKRLRKMQRAIKTNADGVLEGVVQRGGKEGLKMKDIYDLRLIVEKAWFGLEVSSGTFQILYGQHQTPTKASDTIRSWHVQRAENSTKAETHEKKPQLQHF